MTLADIKGERAESPADLIDLGEQLVQGPGEVPVPAAQWAFRGQSQAYGTLAPSFQRIFGQRKSVGAAEIIEQDLIKTFREHYAELEGRTEGMPAPPFVAEGYNLRCLSVMQHYGVPTRLLDWTSSFWTAVYFACAGDPSKDAELWMYDRGIFNGQLTQSPEYGSLYVAPPAGILPPTEPDLLRSRRKNLLLELDPRITPRMREQFAHHTVSSDVFADHVPLLLELAERARSSPGPETRFRRVLIAAGCKEKALRFLEQQQSLTARTIFPDVEGLGKFLHWHLESLVTTLL